MGGFEGIAGGLREGGTFLHSSREEKPEELAAFVVMRLAGETFAIGIEKVKEIIRIPHITWLPGAPSSIRGVINLRGSIVPVVDLAVILSVPASEVQAESRVVIIERDGGMLGMLVDEVQGVAEVPPQSLEPVMPTLNAGQRDCLLAQAEINGRLAGVLDVEKLLDSSMSNKSGMGEKRG